MTDIEQVIEQVEKLWTNERIPDEMARCLAAHCKRLLAENAVMREALEWIDHEQHAHPANMVSASRIALARVKEIEG